MIDFTCHSPTLAVFPVLVGPLQTLLALLPAILLGIGSMVFAAFKPAGFLKLIRFCWRQKLFLSCVAVAIACWRSGVPARSLFGSNPTTPVADVGARTGWDAFRGGARRLGRGPSASDPTAGTPVWRNDRDKTVLSSPALTGDRVIFATATDIGPFSPEGRGAIVCVDAHSGKEIWRYAPDNYRATFSSPVVHENDVVCGEGLHQVDDARITCLDLSNGTKKWEFRTNSHVESTAAIAEGRVFIGAGDDGIYCLSLEPLAHEQPLVVWHLNGEEFRDCESSPVVSEGVVYFGLGDGGFAVCAVEAKTGQLLWRVETPYPVFAPPTVANGKLLIATGNGNFVQSAADLREMKLQMLKEEGASDQQLAEARERLKPVGEVWCIDLATHAVDWKFETGDAILGAIVCAEDSLYFGSRDGHLYRVSPDGKLLQKFDLHDPLISSPALGLNHVYCTTASGRLFCLEARTLKPVWDASLGGGETFASSPTIAHGHVYIGTAQEGLRCLGQPETPQPPLWTQGERGGSADDNRVPDSLSMVWQFPTEGDTPIVATAPLMPLDGAVYAAGTRGGQQEFLKLDIDPSTEHAHRQLWSRRFDNPITVPPVGCGHRLCAIEGASAPGTQPTLHCLSADDGHILWSHSLADLPNGVTLDSQHVFVWTDATRLGCLKIADGSMIWEETIEGGRGLGAPTVMNNILFAVTEASLSARDALSGARLWEVRLVERPRGGPIVDGRHVLLPCDGQLAVQDIVDGKFVRWQPLAEGADADWHIPDEAGRPVTPRVSLKGRVYFATERCAIVCLGAEQP